MIYGSSLLRIMLSIGMQMIAQINGFKQNSIKYLKHVHYSLSVLINIRLDNS